MEFFKPDDFKGLMSNQAITEQANKLLNEKLGPVVYSENIYLPWKHEKFHGATRKAFLFGIEEIKKYCKHEPQFPGYGELICKHCGAELVAEWIEKK